MTSTTPVDPTTSTERDDLLAELNQARFFLRHTAQNLTDEQSAARTTVSELCVAGLIKHVTEVERNWVGIIRGDNSGMKDFDDMTEADFQKRVDEFKLLPGETLAEVVAAYDEVAAETNALVATIDLNSRWPLPKAPWFQETSRSTRRVLIHIIAETAQHAGHADIIREAIDGQKSMG
ncbi:DinB family protein [Nocardia callitridis]|uniref:DinB family protein n=1 Tax=Nocardia callitridis TaxID=648753 RepID=A0ABP9K804_9NOCA